MSGRLSGKVAIVVGGSRGIGRAIAEKFASEGARVLVVAKTEKNGIDCVESINKAGGVASFQLGDVSKFSDMEEAVRVACSRYGTVHILVQNVGIYPTNYLDDITEDDWDRVLDTNLKGTFLAIKACLPVMKEQSYGKIVITSSITGPRTAVPGQIHYGTSKAGLLGLIHMAALELAKYHICINAVEAGWVSTEGIRNAFSDEELINIAKVIPLGKFADPKDIANAMLFLASDESNYITGQTMIVDGGLTLVETKFS